MAAFTSLGSLLNTTASPHTVVATPAVDDLIVVVVWSSKTSDPVPTLSDDNADGLGAYTEIVRFYDTLRDHYVGIWIRNAKIGSATSTTFTQNATTDTGGGLHVFKVTGMSKVGSAAAKQSASAIFASGGTPAVTMGAAFLSANAGIAGLSNGTNPAGVTQPASWTEPLDTGYNTPTSGSEDATRDSGETGSTITWGSTSASVGSAVVVELDASLDARARPMRHVDDAVDRAAVI